jgi:hypothetical protein
MKQPTPEQWKRIGDAVPMNEFAVADFAKYYEGKLIYTPINIEKSTHALFKEAWFNFYYKESNGIEPKFTPTDAKQINEIIKYLTQIAGTELEALTLWQQILSNFHLLSDFYKKNKDLKLINSKLNAIIHQIKQNGTTHFGSTDRSVQL